MSFAQPCGGTVITMWSEERVRWILKDTAEKTQPWHRTDYVVMNPRPPQLYGPTSAVGVSRISTN